jgi:hypothetical protein
VAIAALAVGCGSPAPPATPPGSATGPTSSSPAVFGRDWGRSTSIVERPEEAFESLDPSVLLPEGSGRSGHPSHFPGQAVMADIVRAPAAYVSVGYVYPGWRPVAWTSADGEEWSLHRLGDTEYTFPVGLAVGADRTIVAVGRSGPVPIAWTSTDGVTWTAHGVPILGKDGVAERMTTVVAVPDGFLAGGSVGPETLGRHARFWHSTDGVAWTPVADDAGAFDDAEVLSIVRAGPGFVAVGPTGEAFKPTGSVAWTSPDGEHWTRIDAPDLRSGRAVALVAGPDGGLVAVGAALDERAAMAWTSPDGRTWTQAADEPSRRHPGGYIRMNDVTLAGDTFVAVGDYAGLQRPTMVAWLSTDGIHWTRAREVPVFEQCEPYGVVAGPVPAPGGATTPGLVAVGSFGYPDDFIPTVWLSPAH